MEFRDLKKQYQALKPRIDEAVLKVMNDCNFISGAQTKELETSLADYVGVKHCITCANGTDALTLALMSCSVGPGDAVFLPDFTFFASAETPAALGATPVCVDVDADTYNIDPVSMEQEIARVRAEGKLNLKAIITVDLFGLCANYPEIEAIAKKYDILIIEDGAQGFGGRIDNRRACSFGDIATTSFFPAKPLGCYGDGGAIFTNDDKKAALIRSLCVHGKGTDKYDNVRLGMNSRLDTIQAAILLVKLDAFIQYELNDVNKAAAWYTERLREKIKTPVIPNGFYSSWAQYTIQLENKALRDAIQTALNSQGIPTMQYYPKGMHHQGAFYETRCFSKCPVCEKLCDTVLQLPIHPYLTENDVDVISEKLIIALG